MNDIEILIEILKKQEISGGHQPITVSILRFFLEEVQINKEQIEIDKQKEKDDEADEYAKFQTYYGI